MTKTPKTTIGYKGFDKDFKCRGFQYEVGKTYEHDGKVEMCASGFHACENPFDVWNYYGPIDSKFAKVELIGASKDKNQKDTKLVSAKITIATELTISEFVSDCIGWLINNTKKKNSDGHFAQLASSGHFAQLASSGYFAQLASSGYSAKLASSGYFAKLASSGYSAQLASSGYSAQLASSGYSAKLASSGHFAKLASSGDSAQLASSGEDSVIASSGINATAKGAKGTWLSLAEFDEDHNCVGFATGCIGKGRLKPDTYYRAKGGKLVKVD